VKESIFTRGRRRFIDTGSGGGICVGAPTHDRGPRRGRAPPRPKAYTLIKEARTARAPPIKTEAGWPHSPRRAQHGRRLRYVIYAFLTALDDPAKVIYSPAAIYRPRGEERVGDVSNVVFTNGAIADDDGRLLIYYASSDTRLHVAATSSSACSIT